MEYRPIMQIYDITTNSIGLIDGIFITRMREIKTFVKEVKMKEKIAVQTLLLEYQPKKKILRKFMDETKRLILL
jgi:hypothetical protein